MSFIQLAEPQRTHGRWPILALGFRPFFLLAALFAAAAVPLWLLIYEGLVEPVSYLPPPLWHGHEMVFGFAVAVIAGFLLTAVTNWTGRRTASGLGLGALASLWIAGRLALVAPGLPAWAVILLDVAFLPALATVLAVPLLATGNRRNIVFPILLLILALLDLSVHLGAMGVVDWDPSRALRVAIDLVLLMIAVLGGRVIPSFTKNALPAAKVNPCPKASVLALLSVAALAIAEIATDNPTITGSIALAAGFINALRMRGWGSLATLRHPILWILHVGYGWLAVGLVLRGVAELTDIIPSDAGIHALTLGAIGSMIIGMMSRVALGHTGRSISPAPWTVAAYWLVNAAALLRVLFSLASDDTLRTASLIGSGTLWSLAFLFFAIVYLPILSRPRADGRPG
ncbi:MAG TPA: NnrS family protein [Dongiaceae bacterium]|nr:NnrS family protein [Dongiaceae bacterium]